MDANGYGLLNSISDILNTGTQDSDYAIARYLVPHLDDLRSVMITDITQGAFVTRSAVRRFCNRLGFSSFSDLRSQVNTAAYPSDLNHRDLHAPVDEYRENLTQGIRDMLIEMNALVTNEELSDLAHRLHRHANVLLLCANNTSGTLIRFQQELFFAQKFIQVVSDSYTERLAEANCEEDCLAIVVSASGTFANKIQELIAGSAAEKYLITANTTTAQNSLYDRTYCIGRNSMTYDTSGLFGKYGMTYFFDLLSAYYLHIYV